MQNTPEHFRKLVIDALKYASVPGLMNNPSVEGFIKGTTDISLNTLEIDSLALMELLISIELETGLSLSPQEILKLRTLNSLATRLFAHSNHSHPTSLTSLSETNTRSNKKQTDITKLYLRCSRNLYTENLHNKLHIALENRLAPQQVADIARGLKNPHGASNNSQYSWLYHLYQLILHYFRLMQSTYRRKHRIQYSWISQLKKMLLSYSGKNKYEEFSRKRVAPNIHLYSGPGSDVNKILIICFTGNSLRLMMPTPLFLQHLDPKKHDIVLIRDPEKNSYTMGLPGVADNLETAIDLLPQLIPFHPYQQVVSFGTSAGGLPAIITALRLGLDAGMSVGGGNLANEDFRQFNNHTSGDVITRNPQSDKTRLYLVYGRESAEDKKHALALADNITAETIEISDPDKPVLHNAIFNIVEQKKLGEFLNRTILAGH